MHLLKPVSDTPVFLLILHELYKLLIQPVRSQFLRTICVPWETKLRRVYLAQRAKTTEVPIKKSGKSPNYAQSNGNIVFFFVKLLIFYIQIIDYVPDGQLIAIVPHWEIGLLPFAALASDITSPENPTYVLCPATLRWCHYFTKFCRKLHLCSVYGNISPDP